MLPKGLTINCHEFHKSFVELNKKSIYRIRKVMYDDSIKEWKCGYVKNNTLAAYGHVHFLEIYICLKVLWESNKVMSHTLLIYRNA